MDDININDINITEVISSVFDEHLFVKDKELTEEQKVIFKLKDNLNKAFVKAKENRLQRISGSDKERTLMFAVWRHNGVIKSQASEDIDNYHLYGYLKPFVLDLEEWLIDGFQRKESSDDDMFL